jgi:prepilin-type N-terminal cleavage/methylation domain-containing protein
MVYHQARQTGVIEMNLHKQHGVTLFELMITVAIVAVLVGIAIPMYSGYTLSAYRAECNNEIAAIELALSENFLENNTYFAGADIPTLETASGGLYVSSYNVPGDAAATAANIAAANCTYAVIAGATGNIATSYQVTATGSNNLAGEGCVSQKPTPCP